MPAIAAAPRGLDRPGTRPRPPAHRHVHGQPGTHAVSLGGNHSNRRPGRGVWRQLLLMFVAACLARTAACDGSRRAFWPLVPAGIALAAALAYGHVRMSVPPGEPLGRVALIQGSTDTRMKSDPAQKRQDRRRLFRVVATGRRGARQGRSDRLAGNDVPLPADHLRCELLAAGNLRRHGAGRVQQEDRARAPGTASGRWATPRNGSVPRRFSASSTGTSPRRGCSDSTPPHASIARGGSWAITTRCTR